MIGHWTKFEGTPNGRRREAARITLAPNCTISFNAHAFRAFGEPSAFELFFDGNRNMIGLLPCDPQKKNAFPIRKRRNGKHVHISIGAFLTHFSIKPTSTMLFDEIDLDQDGMIVLDMKKTTNVSRGSR